MAGGELTTVWPTRLIGVTEPTLIYDDPCGLTCETAAADLRLANETCWYFVS